ncbi:hypothetical protein HK098_003346 [Nowakowskiella sp. JEL0407]|nr:hypothetical protein HK098_003346 [Nowakowskiella sp. JEL0407]
MSASSKTPTRGWGTSPSSSNIPNLREILESSAASKQSPQTSKASGLSSSPPIPSSASPTKPGLNFAKTPIQTRPPNTQNSAISASSIQLKQSGLSQRERKKLEQQRNNANASPQPTQQQQTPPKPVWGKILQSEEKGKSVGSLSIFKTPSPTQDFPSMVFSTSPAKSMQTVSIANKQKSQSIHQQQFFSTPSSPPPIASSSSSQFKKPTPSSPPKATTSLFKKSILEIQREEQSEKQRIEKIKRSRPLTDIQKEERAVEALREYYEMTKEPGSGEWFEVVVGDTV